MWRISAKMLLLLSIILFAGDLAIAGKKVKKKNIVVIHSYSMDYEWTAGEDDGIKKAVKQYEVKYSTEINVRRFFLEGKKNKELSERIHNRVTEVKEYIVANQLDGAILTDDLAFSVFYLFLSKLNIPMTFCGINGKIEQYGYKKGDHNITGTLERYNLIPTLKIISQLRPTIDTVIFIGDTSLTTDVLFNDLKNQNIKEKLDTTPIKKIKYFSNEYIDQLQDFLLGLDPARNAVVYIAPYTYTDREGNHVNYREVDKWASAHTKIIDAGITNYQVKNGRLLSLASNQVESGYYAAIGLLKGFESGSDLSAYKIRQYLPLKLILNKSRAHDLKLDIPFSLFAYSYDSQKLFDTFDIP